MSDFVNPMRELHGAHRNFKSEWRRWQNGEIKRKEKKELKGLEPESVSLARDKFYESLENLYQTKIYPLESKFCTDPQIAVDEVIEFLSVDIPAFRCGYAKEIFLSDLKKVSLSPEQKQRILQVTLEVCEAFNFRREFRRWCRLMIKLADREFVEKLTQLSKSTNRYAAIKSKWMLETIFRHRKDLAQNY
jgi:hypothetical protein